MLKMTKKKLSTDAGQKQLSKGMPHYLIKEIEKNASEYNWICLVENHKS